MTPDPRALRELGKAAAQASDRQLLKLIGVLDRLPQRFEADALLAPVRPRLRTLRPARPLSLPRLLFLPVDPLLMAAADWRGNVQRVPRSAIMPIVNMLCAAEPGLVAEVEGRMRGQTVANIGLCTELGERIWPAAAAALPQGAPDGWGEAGLPATAWPGVYRICGAVWRHGPALWALRQAGPDGPPEEVARPVFRELAASGSDVIGIALGALLPFAARPAQLIACVAAIDRAFAPAAEQALEAYLDGVAAPDASLGLDVMADAARRFAGLIEDVERSLSRDRPRRAQQLQALRASALAACTARLSREAESGLLEPLNALLLAREVTDAEVEALETRARGLRELAEAGRRMEAGNTGDRGLERVLARLAAATLRLPLQGPGFLRPDALRLIEILAGPDAAAKLGGSA
jgi:hypothetical protein